MDAIESNPSRFRLANDARSCAGLLFAVVIALLPIGLGGNRPLPLGFAQAWLAISFLLCAAAPIAVEWPKRVRIALGFCAVVIFWAFLQTQSFLPESWAHPIWQRAAGVLQTDIPGRIALMPEEAMRGITHLVTYIMCGVLAFTLGQNSKMARRILEIMWRVGAGICIYGLIMRGLGLEAVLWFPKTAYLGDLTATFISRNHFAIYAGLMWVTGLSLTAQSWREAAREGSPIRDWLMRYGAWRIMLLALMALAIVLSHSRAGLVISLMGGAGYFLLYQFYTRERRRIVYLLGACLALLWLAGAVLPRFDVLMNDFSTRDRAQVYQLTLHAIADKPWLGYGLGSFPAIFRFYQPGMVMEFNHAHSDVLERVLDLGLSAALLLWGAIALVLSGLWHGIRARKHNGYLPTLGLTAGLMGIAHGGIDFSLQIPAITLGWVTIMCLGLAQSFRPHR